METHIPPTGAPPLPSGFTLRTIGGDTVAAFLATSPNGKVWRLGSLPDGKLAWIPDENFPTLPVREFMIAQGLRMEVKFPGMRMTAKAPKCSTILRKEYGMKGKPERLLEQFLAFRGIELKERP